MAQREFKYRRQDFGELPMDLEHLDLHISFWPDRVETTCTLTLRAREELSRLELDARDLEIAWVRWHQGGPQGPGQETAWEYQPQRAKLVVTPPGPVAPGQRFALATRSICHPSESLLEGIYRDVTPPGAPQQYISQCQQWGFQRIAPILDDCRAKCTYRTTLEGDAAYTHLISNGNIDKVSNPAGRPEPLADDPTRQSITFVNEVPMAPYLFLAAAGTWDELVDEVAYPSGKKVRLEYLVPPGKVDQVRIPMAILKESVLWIGRTQGYEYPFDTYRTITMTRSNFGGMENVGNTTIVTAAALIEPEHTLDGGLLYAHQVIVHEFEHNQCGSETTMATPFDLWLNEAYTVDVERRFMADLFDPGFIRLRELDSIRHPLVGPLALEDGGTVGRIVREGFNDPDELIDGVTYVKAAEVIGMLRSILGQAAFDQGKDLYFSRYRGGNADSDQFFACFEEVAGVSLEEFKEQWLYTIGYPKVTARTAWDAGAGAFRLEMTQTCPAGVGPFHIPVDLALVDEQGRDIPGTAQTFAFATEEAELTISGLAGPPAFASLGRGASFYGVLDHQGVSLEELRAQVRADSDAVARVEAMRRLTERQRMRLLEEPEAVVEETWLAVVGDVLTDAAIPPGLKGYLLRIDEEPLDRDQAARFPELVAAREALMKAVNQAYRPALVAAFSGLDTYTQGQAPWEGIEERFLKAVLLGLIAVDDSPASHELILEHYRRATAPNDRVVALRALAQTGSDQRLTVLEEAYRAWHGDLNGYANYLGVVSAGTRPDVFDLIAREESRPSFDLTQPTWSRALYLGLAANSKMLWTPAGIAWLKEKVIDLAPVNATTTSRMLNAFQMAGKMRSPWRERVTEALREIADRVDDAASPTVRRQAAAYLAAAEG